VLEQLLVKKQKKTKQTKTTKNNKNRNKYSDETGKE
jgi:hypothetical protein